MFVAMISYDPDDSHSVALCAWKEARGEGDDGMRAVMHVIVNRVGAQGFPKTVHEVVYEKNQFTSMSVPSDPEFNLQPLEGDVEFGYCLEIVEDVLDGKDDDLTNGACYYADLHDATSNWFFQNIVRNPVAHPRVATIGKQMFFR